MLHETKEVKRTSKQHAHAMQMFSKQFKNIKHMNKLYINAENKVYAGEWIDINGVINFNGGYAVDVVKTIVFVD